MLILAGCAFLAWGASVYWYPDQVREYANDPLGDQASGSSIRITPVSYDFSQLNEGQIKEFIYTIHNDESCSVHIVAVKPQCGCIALQADLRELAPGESYEFSVRFDSHGMDGPLEKRTAVILEKPDGSTVVLFAEFRGEVLPSLRVSPNRVNLGTIEYGKTYEFEVELYSGVIPILKLLPIEIELVKPFRDSVLSQSLTENMRVEAHKVSPQRYMLTGQFTPWEEATSGTAAIRISSDYIEIADYDLLVTWDIQHPLEVNPKSIVSVSEDLVARQITVRPRTPGYHAAVRAITDLEGCQIDVSETDEGVYVISLTITQPDSVGSMQSGYVTIIPDGLTKFSPIQVPVVITWNSE